MAYTGVEMLMADLKQLIYGTHNPLINHVSLVLSKRPQFRLLYEEVYSIIQTPFFHEHHHLLHEPQKVTDLKRRFKDAAAEAQDIIDLFLSAVHFRNEELVSRSNDVFKTSLDLDNVMRSIESVKVEFMTINKKVDFSPRIDHLKTQSATAKGTSCTRNPLGTKKPMEEIVVGLDRDAELIRDKLAEDQKQLDVVSIVGMGGLGKTTLATRVFNDRFIVYHFHVRIWVTVSQTYGKRDLLIQILASIGVQVDHEKDTDSILGGKLHKHLMGKRYLIVIDDIWSIDVWDDLNRIFPHDNTGSRILLTSRLKEVALHAKPHGFIHTLPYLTKEQSWELLRKKVFRGNECPEWLIEPGMQIAKKCQGLPLSLVLIAGVLAKEALMVKYFWEKIACSVSLFIASEQKGYLETLALSYHHLPHHLRDCFLYLGGFPEDFRFGVERLIWLWGAEGFIEEAGDRSLEDIAKAYLMDLIDRNLLIVVERTFDGDVKACKVHDLVRELCLKKAKEERFFLTIAGTLSPQFRGVTTPYEQHRVFINQYFEIVNFSHRPTPSIRSLLYFGGPSRFIFQDAEYFRSFALLRVLDLRKYPLVHFPRGIALLVHLRYLAICFSSDFPSAICNLWSLQTLIVTTIISCLCQPFFLPSNISDLVNLRHLWSNKVFCLPSIDKPMNLQSISTVVLGDGVENFQKCFPDIKKLASLHLISNEVYDFELHPYLETLKLTGSCFHARKPIKPEFPNCGNNHIRFPAILKKLTLANCCLPWSDMSIIQSLPNLEVLKLTDRAFVGPLWNTGEEQFQQLKFLRLEKLDIKQWELCSINFPCLKRLQVMKCYNLEEIPVEIGDISTLELLEVDSRSNSIFKSLQNIQLEQHAEGNYDLKINFNNRRFGMCCEEVSQDGSIDGDRISFVQSLVPSFLEDSFDEDRDGCMCIGWVAHATVNLCNFFKNQ